MFIHHLFEVQEPFLRLLGTKEALVELPAQKLYLIPPCHLKCKLHGTDVKLHSSLLLTFSFQ